MKKLFSLLLSAALLLIMTAGCGENRDPVSPLPVDTEITQKPAAVAPQDDQEDQGEQDEVTPESAPKQERESDEASEETVFKPVVLSTLRREGSGGVPTGQMGNFYCAADRDELRSFLDLIDSMELPQTLPVYMERYPTGDISRQVSEEEKASYKEVAEQFLTASGYAEYVERGLHPDLRSLNDAHPVYELTFDSFSMAVQARGISIMTELEGLADMNTEDIRALIDEMPFLRAGCRYAGITEPTVAIINTETRRYARIRQQSDDTIQTIINKGINEISISIRNDSPSTVILIPNPEKTYCAGYYPTLSLEEAKERLLSERGVDPESIAAWALEYRNTYYAGCYVPCLVAYYEYGTNQKTGLPSYAPVYTPIVADAPEE